MQRFPRPVENVQKGESYDKIDEGVYEEGRYLRGVNGYLIKAHG